MTDLTTFLTARLDELEATARAASPGSWKLWGMTVMADQDGSGNVDHAVGVAQALYRDVNGKPRTFDARHIATHDPAYVLADVEAKRAMLAMHADGDCHIGKNWTLMYLARPFKDHPDFDPAWLA